MTTYNRMFKAKPYEDMTTTIRQLPGEFSKRIYIYICTGVVCKHQRGCNTDCIEVTMRRFVHAHSTHQ